MNKAAKNAIDYEVWRFKQSNDIQNITVAQIESLMIEKGQARLYNEDTLTYGEFITVDDAGNKKIYFFVLQNLALEMYERHGVQ